MGSQQDDDRCEREMKMCEILILHFTLALQWGGTLQNWQIYILQNCNILQCCHYDAVLCGCAHGSPLLMNK